MAGRIIVKPKKDIKAVHPNGAGYITKTVELERTPQVIRAIRCGDLIEVKPASPKRTPKKKNTGG